MLADFINVGYEWLGIKESTIQSGMFSFVTDL